MMSVFFLHAEYVVCGKLGRQPISVVLVNEAGDELYSSALHPPAAVTNWRPEVTGYSTHDELLANEPTTLDVCALALRDHLDGYSFVVGFNIASHLQALGLRSGIDYGGVVDISDWFAIPIAASTTQYFTLAHIVNCALGGNKKESNARMDVHHIRSLYTRFAQTAREDPELEGLRQQLLEALPGEQRVFDAKLVVRFLSVPESWKIENVRELIPKALRGSIKTVKELQFAPLANGATLGRTVVVFKTAEKAAEMMLRLHSNPDEWEWVVKKDGYYYLHKQLGIKVEELCDSGTQVFLHSIPDGWSDANVRWLVPEDLQSGIHSVKLLQYRENKSKTARLGRTHLAFANEAWLLEMLRRLQDMTEWSWSTTGTGGLIYQHNQTGTILEPVRNISWEQLMAPEQRYF